MELVIGTSHSGAVAYDLPGSANARVLWGTGRGSFLRAGVAPAEPAALVATVAPGVQVVEAGGSAVYRVSLGGVYGGAVTMTADAPTEVAAELSETVVNLPAEVTLTVTDLHPVGPLRPGVWYEVGVTATAGDVEQRVTVRLLVGGWRNYLPAVVVRKGH